MKKLVKVISVIKDYEKEKRDGGTYLCTLFSYEDAGQMKSIALANAFLNAQKALAGKLDKLTAGQEVEISLEKNGMFWNLTDVGAPGTVAEKTTVASSGAKAPAKSSYDDHQIGLQVGNALNNAAILIAHGKVDGDLESVALDVLAIGNRLKERLKTGDLSSSTKATSAPSREIVDDDIPFGD